MIYNRRKPPEELRLYSGGFPPFARNGSYLIETDRQKELVYTSFLIQMAISDCTSLNPFEKLGLDFSIIFSVINNSGGGARTAILDVLRQFSDRLEVKKLDIIPDNEGGNIKVDLSVIYLPTGEEVELSSLLSKG